MIETINQKRAVIYCRVSTKEQAEEGNSLVTQERNCRDYAFKNGFDIAEVFIEQGESAKTADRTELQKLFHYCANRKNNIQAVVSYKIDRISRNTDDYSQIRLLLKRYGVEIKSTSEYFENTPAGRFMENIIANVAQFDNDVRTERSIGGMRDAMREGRYVWQAPIGYVNQRVNGKVNIVQNESAPLIKKIFEELAKKELPTDQVRKQMCKYGLCTKDMRPLAKSYFYRLIKNELYAGWVCKFGERHKGTFEPIVSEELFNAVQRAIKSQKISRPYTLKNPDFILRRFVTHPKGEKLTGSWSRGRNKEYAYYRFRLARLQWSKEYLDTLFLSFVNKFSFDEGRYTCLKKAIREQLIKKSEKKKAKLVSFLQRQTILKDKQKTLVEKSLKGVISDTIVKEQMNLLEEELWEVNQYITDSEDKMFNFGRILDDLNDFFLAPAETWKRLPHHVQESLLWFEFPNGITFDGTEFRTTKICSLFKLKELLLGDKSSKVNYRGQNSEHHKTINSPALQMDNNVLFYEDIRKELISLHDLLKDEIKNTRLVSQ